jgi:PmbA protein
MERKMNKQMHDLCKWVLETAAKAGAKDARVGLNKSRQVEIQYRDKKPEIIKQATTVQMGIDLFVEGRYSSQSTCDLRKDALKEFISDAVSSTKLISEDPYRTLPDPKYYKGRADTDLKLVDDTIDNLSAEQKHKIVKEAENAAWSAGGDKVVTVEAGFNDELGESVTLTSNGFSGYTKATNFVAVVSVSVSDSENRKPIAYDYAERRFHKKLGNPEIIGANAARKAIGKLGAKKIETATLPVIIDNRNVHRIIGGFFEALDGRNIYRKQSFLADKKGQKIGSDKFVLVDDPFIPEGMASRLYDGDGFAVKKRTIVEAGILKDFYIDWYYSRKLACEPTSGSNGNMIVPPGTRSVEQIIKDLGKGILVTDFLGGNSNPTTGDFSVGIFGQYFENGKIVHPVSEMNIADNHLKFWHKLTECANDPWLYSDWRTPSMVFTDVVVSGV